jgi:hypothetical protein
MDGRGWEQNRIDEKETNFIESKLGSKKPLEYELEM